MKGFLLTRPTEKMGITEITEKELRKLNRSELLEMLIAQSTELQTCKEQLAKAEDALQKREIILNEAGSIAEASLRLNGIFEAAQAACQQYTDNIHQLSERQKNICAELETQSRQKADQILAEAERKRQEMENASKVKCEEMVKKAKADSQQYWNKISLKMQEFYDAHEGLRELMSMNDLSRKQDKKI